jgi:hypothetical protein
MQEAQEIFCNARKACGEKDEHRTSNIERRIKNRGLTLGIFPVCPPMAALSGLGIRQSIQTEGGGDGILNFFGNQSR